MYSFTNPMLYTITDSLSYYNLYSFVEVSVSEFSIVTFCERYFS